MAAPSVYFVGGENTVSADVQRDQTDSANSAAVSLTAAECRMNKNV